MPRARAASAAYKDTAPASPRCARNRPQRARVCHTPRLHCGCLERQPAPSVARHRCEGNTRTLRERLHAKRGCAAWRHGARSSGAPRGGEGKGEKGTRKRNNRSAGYGATGASGHRSRPFYTRACRMKRRKRCGTRVSHLARAAQRGAVHARDSLVQRPACCFRVHAAAAKAAAAAVGGRDIAPWVVRHREEQRGARLRALLV